MVDNSGSSSKMSNVEEGAQESESQTSYDAIHKIFMDDWLKLITDPEFNAMLGVMHKALAYKNFDPAELVERMKRLQPNKDALAKDLTVLIVQFLTVKQSVDKKIPKQNKSDIIELKRLTKLYKIVKRPSDEAITLRRIAIAFAPLTVRILMEKKIERPVTNAELYTMADDTLPWCIRTQIYLCTLPAYDNPAVTSRKTIFETAIRATVCYSYLEAKVISVEGKNKNWTNNDYMTDVMKYSVVYAKSEHLSQKDRLDLWNETIPSLSYGQGSMEKLIKAVESEVPEFSSMFEINFRPIISSEV